MSTRPDQLRALEDAAVSFEAAVAHFEKRRSQWPKLHGGSEIKEEQNVISPELSDVLTNQETFTRLLREVKLNENPGTQELPRIRIALSRYKRAECKMYAYSQYVEVKKYPAEIAYLYSAADFMFDNMGEKEELTATMLGISDEITYFFKCAHQIEGFAACTAAGNPSLPIPQIFNDARGFFNPPTEYTADFSSADIRREMISSYYKKTWFALCSKKAADYPHMTSGDKTYLLKTIRAFQELPTLLPLPFLFPDMARQPAMQFKEELVRLPAYAALGHLRAERIGILYRIKNQPIIPIPFFPRSLRVKTEKILKQESEYLHRLLNSCEQSLIALACDKTNAHSREEAITAVIHAVESMDFCDTLGRDIQQDLLKELKSLEFACRNVPANVKFFVEAKPKSLEQPSVVPSAQPSIGVMKRTNARIGERPAISHEAAVFAPETETMPADEGASLGGLKRSKARVGKSN